LSTIVPINFLQQVIPECWMFEVMKWDEDDGFTHAVMLPYTWVWWLWWAIHHDGHLYIFNEWRLRGWMFMKFGRDINAIGDYSEFIHFSFLHSVISTWWVFKVMRCNDDNVITYSMLMMLLMTSPVMTSPSLISTCVHW
jgi:hypothetical protein